VTRKAGGYHLVRIRCMIRLSSRCLNPDPAVLGKNAACGTGFFSVLPAFALTLCEVHGYIANADSSYLSGRKGAG
jgi:hypothetical protein